MQVNNSIGRAFEGYGIVRSFVSAIVGVLPMQPLNVTPVHALLARCNGSVLDDRVCSLPGKNALEPARRVQRKDDQWQIVVARQRDCAGIHDTEAFL